MAFSTQRATSDGTLSTLDLTIEYIDQTDVHLFVDDVEMALTGGTTPYTWEWVTSSKIKILPVIPNGSVVMLRRRTPSSEMYHNFDAGAVFKDATVDENFKQVLFLTQESQEGLALSDLFNDLDMHGYDILNLPDATNPKSPVTLAQLNTYYADSAAILRQDLKDPAKMDFGATGDGVADDTAAFTIFESTVSAEPVNLHGRTYVVTAIPNKNAYYNGTWLVGGNRRPAILGRTFLDPSPKMRSIGGQLGDLRRALGDPFHQYTGIVFIGDSITWGTGATGTATSTPRDGTLSDARDVFATASFVNEFKRYIGARYAPLASPILSNHSASPTGQSTAEYQREVIMYPRYGEITLTQYPAGSLSATDVINTGVIGGGQLRLTSGNTAVDFSHTLTFNFTGTDLRMYFSCVATDDTFYELLVDGVSQGVFSMKAGAIATSGTVVDGQSGAYYDHSFSFVRNKVITIRTKRNGEAGNRIARFNAIRILKRIVIKNQGINGSSARVYGPNNLSGLYGDGVAVASTDSFVFCQLGTNDRGIPGANQNPRGPNIFRRYLDATLDYLSADVGVILMCSPPTTNESPASYWLNMTDIRDVIIREAEARSVDFIDNFSTFSDVNMSVVTTDGLHPNDLGYAVIARNLINSLESA